MNKRFLLFLIMIVNKMKNTRIVVTLGSLLEIFEFTTFIELIGYLLKRVVPIEYPKETNRRIIM